MNDICIKWNKEARVEPCALCDAVSPPIMGPALYIEGTGSPVCVDCATRFAPHLVEFLRRALSQPGHR